MKRHECENCEMSFFTRLERKNHTKSLHTLVVTKAKKAVPKKKEYVCEVCTHSLGCVGLYSDVSKVGNVKKPGRHFDKCDKSRVTSNLSS